MSIKEEIIQAVRKLGYKGEVVTALVSFNRLVVIAGGVHIGIYDLDKHTFVD